MVRSMLKAKNFPNKCWEKVVACLVYILNRSLAKSVKDKVPLEAWSAMKASVSHLRISYCIKCAHV